MKVARPRVDYDAAHTGCVACWTCGQRWPTKYDLVLDAYNHELRIDGGEPLPMRPSEAAAMEVLINAFPRWLTRRQLVDMIYDSRPDADHPSDTAALNTIKSLRARLEGTRYTIQHESIRGWRLVDEDTIVREFRELRAQMPDTRASDLVHVSRGAMEDNPKYKKLVAQRNEKRKREAQAIRARHIRKRT